MTAWTSDELAAIGGADELRLAMRRRDGTLRSPVTVWVVRHGDDLYVRSWRGRTAAWFRGVQASHEGHIQPMVAPEARAATLKLVPHATTE